MARKAVPPSVSRAKKSPDVTKVEATKHVSSRRKNIPTAELEAFAEEAERKPATVLYPRDPTLDPQLVWKGKEQQDADDLAVPVLPVYIQEKIAPQAIIEELRAEQRRVSPEPQLDLFSDFNGLEFEQLIDFYQHSQHWSNRMILGDSLLVMASLTEKEGLKGQVQMIYLDPPYGVKFGSNWQVSTRRREIRDGRAEDATRQPEQVRAFRDTWKLGIHSYLTYLRDRLVIARDLLTESGSIFVQIGDENMHLVRSLLDEVFGSANAVTTIVVKKKGATTPTDPVNDYLLWYARDRTRLRARRVFVRRDAPEDDPKFNTLIGPSGDQTRVADLPESEVQGLVAKGYRWARVNYPIVSQHPHPERSKNFRWHGKEFSCGQNGQWRFDLAEGMPRLALAERLFDGGGDSLGGVVYWDDFPYVVMSNLWSDLHGEQEGIYVVQTNRKIVERCILMTTDVGDLVVDPTCGSGTTAFMAEWWGRRWITIDTSRVALALARTRLMAARFPYYILKDSPAGIRKDAELSGLVPPSPLPPTGGDIRQGFVYERIPQITLKAIADNPEVREGMSRDEINAAIARRAEFETLYDKPIPENRTVRVSGPFTVESLSPHRIVSAERSPVQDQDAGRFVTTIVENLRKAGVQNTMKNERLTFDRLDPWPGGMYVQAAGDYSEGGRARPVAVAIGPEHGTVGVEFVREAAKEAVRFADLLVVCGFAFEAHVEDTGHLGKLTILKAKMNPDLAMGEELLKKTGAGNLFMVFGEPDIQIKPEKDNAASVEIRGVDVYDPTTGVVRSHSTDDIATWFIDTNYNEESFFVRHAYFLGADDPYDKLKRALRADIDEAAWASLYSTKSRPFPKPDTGKIAIKVINHYGDEVLKVYSIEDDTSRGRAGASKGRRTAGPIP